MPIYEYRCDSCGHQLEAMQKIADNPLIDCPECSQPELKKLISAVAFRLKGSGWYETDFKSGDNKKNLADSGEKGEKSDKSSDSKSDSGSAKADSSSSSESKSQDRASGSDSKASTKTESSSKSSKSDTKSGGSGNKAA